MSYRYGIILLLFFSLFAFTGCQFTQSSFARTTSNAGGSFAAASTTLSYFHQGRITRPYTSSSFEGFQEELQGLGQQLPSLSGVPDKQALQQLLRAYKQAI
jgi:hypothetical protein